MFTPFALLFKVLILSFLSNLDKRPAMASFKRDSSNRCFELPLCIGQGDSGDRETSRLHSVIELDSSTTSFEIAGQIKIPRKQRDI